MMMAAVATENVNKKNWCKKKNGVCQPTSPGSSYQALEKLCKEGCYCWVKQQDPDCSGGKCPFATDECSKTNPDPLLNGYDTWLNSTEICNENGCNCWRQCPLTESCWSQGGKCYPTNPGYEGEFLGECKNGCQCWRPISTN